MHSAAMIVCAQSPHSAYNPSRMYLKPVPLLGRQVFPRESPAPRGELVGSVVHSVAIGCKREACPIAYARGRADIDMPSDFLLAPRRAATCAQRDHESECWTREVPKHTFCPFTT